jgi:hypothetical protein
MTIVHCPVCGYRARRMSLTGAWRALLRHCGGTGHGRVM